MGFSPDYMRLVLSEAFEDAKRLFIGPLMAIHYAHLTMLTEQGIVSIDDACAIRQGLDAIDQAALAEVSYDGSSEDLFFHVNRLLDDRCGTDVAGRLHAARSRNDIDMTMYRMLLRDWVLTLAEQAVALRAALLEIADTHRTTVFAAHTHAQPAQPTTLAHYMLAVVEALERDGDRLLAAYATTNRSPLGACAITGTGFPIDRRRTSDLLGFSAPTGNTYGSIAAVDYLLESAAAAAILVAGLGRFSQDMLLWSTAELGYLRLPDSLVQISSIMPQKRNPVALEHARALSSKAWAELGAVAQIPHNTPFGDIVDTEDDLQPLVRTAFRDATRAVALVATTMAQAGFDVARMAERAGREWVTVTELADELTRRHGLAFDEAHTVVSTFVRRAREDAGRRQAAVLVGVAAERGHAIRISDADLERLLSPAHFIEVRRTPGGPAPDVVVAAVAAARARLAADRDAVADRRRALANAEALRRRAVEAL
jgi:argininosuccinate lyase